MSDSREEVIAKLHYEAAAYSRLAAKNDCEASEYRKKVAVLRYEIEKLQSEAFRRKEDSLKGFLKVQ
jgi:hypothetical protein